MNQERAVGSLASMLGLNQPQVAAIVGSGGKTTLLYALGQELAAAKARVVLTTTTRLYPPLAGQVKGTWLTGTAPLEMKELTSRLTSHSPLLIATELDGQGKLLGVEPSQVVHLNQDGKVWVLVEADGAAGRPLKGWAEHEPPLPAGMGLLIVVVGALGLGRPLDSTWVHRPHHFARASGLVQGQRISPQALNRVLCGPQGPLRNLPPGTSTAVLVNQAETASPRELARLGRELGKSGRFQRQILGSLKRGRFMALAGGMNLEQVCTGHSAGAGHRFTW